jgi:hypothetical protein
MEKKGSCEINHNEEESVECGEFVNVMFTVLLSKKRIK